MKKEIILGVVTIILGVIALAMLFTCMVHDLAQKVRNSFATTDTRQLQHLPVTWVIIPFAAIAAVIFYFNRKPANA